MVDRPKTPETPILIYGQEYDLRGEKPAGLTMAFARLLPKGGTILDIGAGNGRSALYLASQGLHVQAVEASHEVARDLQTQAEKQHLPITVLENDIRDLRFHQEYDGVLVEWILHYLSDKDARDLIERVKAQTRPGGLHGVAVVTNEGEAYAQEPKKGNFYPPPGALEQLYADWKIRLANRRIPLDILPRDKSAAPVKAIVERIIARKPEKD